MKIEIDTHTHTVLSGHAHSTILENVQQAKKAGLKGLVSTDHGPDIPNAAPEFNIGTYYMIPDTIDGIRVYKGMEADVTDFSGSIDLTPRYLKMLDFVIASMHEAVIDPGTQEQHTAAMLGALQNPYVDALGHPGNPRFAADYEAVVVEAARMGKLMEINNHSFTAREGCRDNCALIIRLCKQMGVRIIVSSDAHICFAVGSFAHALEEIALAHFPEELVVNRTQASFEQYLAERKRRLEGIE